MDLNNKFNENGPNLNEQYKLNLNWIKINYNFLLSDYENKYVAVKDEDVIDSDSVLLSLLKRVERSYRNSWKSVAILFINKEHKILNPFLHEINDKSKS
jgi:hypothetical protein